MSDKCDSDRFGLATIRRERPEVAASRSMTAIIGAASRSLFAVRVEPLAPVVA